MNPKYIIIHHSLTSDNTTVNWQAIRRYHIDECKWHDIGYQYGVELVGNEYEILKGRMDNESGAHCLGFNDRSIGICCVGNFDNLPMSAAQEVKLLDLVRSLMDIYGIKMECVLGHRETYAMLGKKQEKTCPGDLFNLHDFRLKL